MLVAKVLTVNIIMGPVFIFILGILVAVGASLYQIGKNNRFEIVSNGASGVFIFDNHAKKLNFCDAEQCKIVNKGVLPSEVYDDPSLMTKLEGSILGQVKDLSQGNTKNNTENTAPALEQQTEYQAPQTQYQAVPTQPSTTNNQTQQANQANAVVNTPAYQVPQSSQVPMANVQNTSFVNKSPTRDGGASAPNEFSFSRS